MRESLGDISEWWARQVQQESAPPDELVKWSKRALALGNPALAFDIARYGLDRHEGHPKLSYRAALALARSGSPSAARDYLRSIRVPAEQDDALYMEVLALEGRIAKDCWGKLPLGPARDKAAADSTKYYERAFGISREPFPGINAAAMSMMAGRRDESLQLASGVLATCRARESREESDYWLLATAGEASILLGNQEDAVGYYRRASAAAGNEYGAVATMRRQLKLLANHITVSAEALDALQVPTVVLFTGHMIDAPDRPQPRFPPYLLDRVETEIGATLEDLDVGIGHCSAACGADIVFVEAMLARGAEVHVTLPFARRDFIKTSVEFAGESWVQRFERALDAVTSVTFATEEGHLGDDILFAYGRQVIEGKAILHARHLETSPILLAVFDLASKRRVGGTVDGLEHWEGYGHELKVIDLAEIRRAVNEPSTARSETVSSRGDANASPAGDETGPAVRIAREIRTMLFADLVGFSKIDEERKPAFFADFLQAVADVIAASDPGPTFANTWGDGLFLVFEGVGAGADFALRLRDTVANTNWAEVGLPADAAVRIGMHSGPVYPAFDPILKSQNYYGSHVNRAARIEPVVTPGAVFISEATACLLEAEVRKDLAWDYLGAVELAKGFGTTTLYRLRRSSEVE